MDGRRHAESATVRISPDEARELDEAYRSASETLDTVNEALTGLLGEAAALLQRPRTAHPLGEISRQLTDDADDLEGRLTFLERTDGFSTAVTDEAPALLNWRTRPAWAIPVETLARYLAEAKNEEEITQLISWMVDTGAFDVRHLAKWNSLDEELRPIFAVSAAIAIENGWWDDDIPPWLAASVVAHGDPSDEAFVSLALHTFNNNRSITGLNSTNPFELPPRQDVFAGSLRRLLADPELARTFVTALLREFDRTGDTVVNTHDSAVAQQLADLIVVAGAADHDIDARTQFVERLVRTINADGNTNSPVFWATWAVHAELVIEHQITTTTPTFGSHRIVPDVVRPHWERAWDGYISPATLKGLFHVADTSADTMLALLTPFVANQTFSPDRATNAPQPAGDPGGTYSNRLKAPFWGLSVGSSEIARGLHIVTHALEDASPGGEIARDEFAIIDHGVGPDGTPSFTVNLPGVIDLSNPVPGFDPNHQSVRDMDQVAIHSAPTASISDNRYAQMVSIALEVHGVPTGANVMLIGHSFGADTVLDLAASPAFTQQYNVSHVVAAAYDSLPQLSAISPDIDVLVLQNSSDQAIALERFNRFMGQGDESVSIDTFTHELRVFPGGLGGDLGHHPDRYINYLQQTSDEELDRFFSSVAETGYANSGASVAIDVSIPATPSESAD